MPQQLPKDRPTAADKKREDDLVKALQKENFYGKKQAPAQKSESTKPKPVIKVTTVKMTADRPTKEDKKRESDMVKALEAEDFYGKNIPKAQADKIQKELREKAFQENVDKLAQDYIRRKRMESPLMKAAKSAKKQ